MTLIRFSIYRIYREGPYTNTPVTAAFVRTYDLQKREKIILPMRELPSNADVVITLEKEANQEGSK